MADHPRVRRKNGVTMAPGASPGKALVLLSVAVSLVCVALLVLFGRPTRAPSPSEQPAPPSAAASASHESDQATAPPAPPAEPPVPAPEPESTAAHAPTAAIDGAEGAEAGDAATVPSGIGLFPPPGTDPIKIGLVVPDDFELPEGYLRHYQVTDDGQALPPILMFHPDYEVLGADGQPIRLPENRVVPAVLAPPGLPMRLLAVPKPRVEEGR